MNEGLNLPKLISIVF